MSVSYVFLDCTKDPKNPITKRNPFNQSEIKSLDNDGLAVLKKIKGESILFQYKKFGSKNYTVSLFVDNKKSAIASKHGNDYRKIGNQVCTSANKTSKAKQKSSKKRRTLVTSD